MPRCNSTSSSWAEAWPGLALAAGLRRSSLSVALVEGRAPASRSGMGFPHLRNQSGERALTGIDPAHGGISTRRDTGRERDGGAWRRRRPLDFNATVRRG